MEREESTIVQLAITVIIVGIFLACIYYYIENQKKDKAIEELKAKDTECSLDKVHEFEEEGITVYHLTDDADSEPEYTWYIVVVNNESGSIAIAPKSQYQ